MSAESGWRRSMSGLADEIAWRMARDAAGRRAGEEVPVALAAGLASARSFLLVVPGRLSSLMTTLPAIRALRRAFPETRFTLATEAIGATLMERDPLVDAAVPVLPLPPLRQRRAFDAACESAAGLTCEALFNFSPRDDRGLALFALASGAKLRIACLAEPAHAIFNVRVVPQSEDRYLVDRQLAFVESLGVRPASPPPAWEVPEREAEVAERLLRLKNLKGARPLIAFDPGPGEEEAGDARTAFGVFAQAVGRKAGAAGVVLSEKEQREMPGADAVEGESRAMGLATLRETLAVLSRCDAFVGANSGFFHAAVSMGLPSVGIFARGGSPLWRPADHPGVRILDAGEEAATNARLAGEHLVSAWGAGIPGGRR